MIELTCYLQNNTIQSCIKYIESFCLRYKINPQSFFENYFIFLLYTYPNNINSLCLDFMEQVCHSKEYKDYEIISYFVTFLKDFLSLSKS